MANSLEILEAHKLPTLPYKSSGVLKTYADVCDFLLEVYTSTSSGTMCAFEKGVIVVFTSLSEKAEVVSLAKIDNLEYEFLQNMMLLLQKACE